jgi:hypothetical protein
LGIVEQTISSTTLAVEHNPYASAKLVIELIPEQLFLFLVVYHESSIASIIFERTMWICTIVVGEI